MKILKWFCVYGGKPFLEGFKIIEIQELDNQLKSTDGNSGLTNMNNNSNWKPRILREALQDIDN